MSVRPSPGRKRRTRRGAASIAAFLLAAVLIGTTGVVMAAFRASGPGEPSTESGLKAQAIAEAGISDKISQMVAGNYADLGSRSHRIALSGGSVWVRVENFDVRNRLIRLTACARYQDDEQTIEAVVRSVVDSTPSTALFAGNRSGDPGYALSFGGSGSGADEVAGDVYCGGDISVRGDARLEGEIRAKGRIDGATGFPGAHRPSPDYGATLREAGRLPRTGSEPIFRKNPPDRSDCTGATAGDDFFLEGSVELPRFSPGLFFIEGDLWIFDPDAAAVRIAASRGASVGVTIVVQGNIHLGTSLRLADERQGGLALVALADPEREDSGDILLGQPSSGSLAECDAFLFAERNIVSCAGGSPARPLRIRGSLAAGNQIRLEVDEAGGRAKLALVHDDRLATGRLALPGIPAWTDRVTAYTVISWSPVAP